MTDLVDIAIVTGGRRYRLTDADRAWLKSMWERFRFRIVLHGDSTGADADAAAWARERGLCTAGCPAMWDEWRRRGNPRGAGPHRNRLMASACTKPVKAICLAFPGDTGTADMCRQVRQYEIPLFESPRGLLRSQIFAERGEQPHD